MTIFKIVYEQSLLADEQDQIVEVRPWTRIELGYEAIQRSWFKRFKPNWLDLPILLAIGLHARPLIGDDLHLLRDLGLARPSDEGRLYARVTDVGLADMLDCSRESVRHSALRLSARGLLRTVDLPRQFRDSRGAFAGNNAYLLPGQTLVSSPFNRANSVGTVGDSHANSVGTVRGSRANSVGTKINTTMSLTPADAGGANRVAPANLNASEEPDPVLDGTDEADEPTCAASGNSSGSHRAGIETESNADPQAYRLLRALSKRLDRAVADDKPRLAWQAVLESLETRFGFTEAGFRAARLSFEPLPDRRRRVLDDLRRMLGRSDLSPSQHKRNLIGILTQNIGVTLGLGLLPDGHLRALADKPDYTVIGGLIDEYGAEVVWLAACEIAGRAFEGDPIAYLRATLRNKRERERGASQSGAGSTPRVGAGMGRFEQLNYLGEQVGVEDA
jgi:hypothetical protein